MKTKILIAVLALAASFSARSAYAALGTDWIEATSSAAWSARYSSSVVVFNDKLWILGGQGASRLNDVWYSDDGVNWTEATSSAAWSPRFLHTAAVFDNKLWVMGGIDGSSIRNDVWYSDDGVNWTEATSSAAWSPRRDLVATTFDNKLWVMGGNDNGGSDGEYNDIWYSTDGVNWTEATSSAAWSARYDFSLQIFNNQMWLMGGYGVSQKNDVWYSDDGVNWTEATSSANWPGRYTHVSAVLDGKLWVIGGYDDGVGTKNDVWYSDDGVNWTEATSSANWPLRIQPMGLAFHNRLWIMGGTNGGVKQNDIWYSAFAYTVSFDEQGGSSVGDISESEGSSVTLPTAPTRSGYTFKNWNTQADGNGTAYDAGASYAIPSGDTTLYAIWDQDVVQSSSSRPSSSGNRVRREQAAASSGIPVSITIPVASSTPLHIEFTRDLKLGMTGSDVAVLQKFLNAHGFLVATDGPGSVGNETTYFGSLTCAAVARYQAANDIAPTAGYFGPLTRAHVLATQ